MSDLIKREDAIKAIKNEAECYIDIPLSDKIIYHDAIRIIRNIPSASHDEDFLKGMAQGYKAGVEDSVKPKQGEWIPVSERLPKRQGYYICTCKDGGKYKRATVVKWSNGWQLTGARAYWVVLAWMPLPEPWKGASDDSQRTD